MVHYYFGDGQGKTTAACGLALRMLGAGKRVVMAQFLKDGSSHEVAALKTFPRFRLLAPQEGVKFVFQMNERERVETSRYCRETLERALGEAETCDLLVLDEAADLCGLGLADTDFLPKHLSRLPKRLEVVLTGHRRVEGLVALADYVSQVGLVKHPYERGVPPRAGVEF